MIVELICLLMSFIIRTLSLIICPVTHLLYSPIRIHLQELRNRCSRSHNTQTHIHDPFPNEQSVACSSANLSETCDNDFIEKVENAPLKTSPKKQSVDKYMPEATARGIINIGSTGRDTLPDQTLSETNSTSEVEVTFEPCQSVTIAINNNGSNGNENIPPRTTPEKRSVCERTTPLNFRAINKTSIQKITNSSRDASPSKSAGFKFATKATSTDSRSVESNSLGNTRTEDFARQYNNCAIVNLDKIYQEKLTIKFKPGGNYSTLRISKGKSNPNAHEEIVCDSGKQSSVGPHRGSSPKSRNEEKFSKKNVKGGEGSATAYQSDSECDTTDVSGIQFSRTQSSNLTEESVKDQSMKKLEGEHENLHHELTSSSTQTSPQIFPRNLKMFGSSQNTKEKEDSGIGKKRKMNDVADNIECFESEQESNRSKNNSKTFSEFLSAHNSSSFDSELNSDTHKVIGSACGSSSTFHDACTDVQPGKEIKDDEAIALTINEDNKDTHDKGSESGEVSHQDSPSLSTAEIIISASDNETDINHLNEYISRVKEIHTDIFKFSSSVVYNLENEQMAADFKSTENEAELKTNNEKSCDDSVNASTSQTSDSNPLDANTNAFFNNFFDLGNFKSVLTPSPELEMFTTPSDRDLMPPPSELPSWRKNQKPKSIYMERSFAAQNQEMNVTSNISSPRENKNMRKTTSQKTTVTCTELSDQDTQTDNSNVLPNTVLSSKNRALKNYSKSNTQTNDSKKGENAVTLEVISKETKCAKSLNKSTQTDSNYEIDNLKKHKLIVGEYFKNNNLCKCDFNWLYHHISDIFTFNPADLSKVNVPSTSRYVEGNEVIKSLPFGQQIPLNNSDSNSTGPNQVQQSIESAKCILLSSTLQSVVRNTLGAVGRDSHAVSTVQITEVESDDPNLTSIKMPATVPPESPKEKKPKRKSKKKCYR